MARISLLACVFLLTLSASFRSSEGYCHQEGAIPLCKPGTRSARGVFIDANTTIGSDDECSCTVTLPGTRNVDIFAVWGSITNCGVNVLFSVGSTPLIDIHCLTTDTIMDREIEENMPIDVTMRGTGTMNSCIYVGTTLFTGSLTVTCREKIKIATTDAPPTTTTQTSPTTTTQSQGPTTTQQPGPTTTQQPGPTTTQQPGPTTTQQPGPTTTQQPGPTTTQQPGPTTTKQPPTQTTAPVPGTTEGFAKFPVPEVAGGVAGGILLIILLVVCITCCTSSRSKKREVDEESLKSHPSQSPEMQESKEGYAFDNILYHASQQDGSQKDESGKSLTPTVSDGSTHDDSAIKGFEELYASVNKPITDSTDIM